VKRREFITLFGSAAAAWPLAAGAQQPERMRRIGVLMGFPQDDPEGQAWSKAFVHGLEELGWVNGRNMQLDIRWGSGDLQVMGQAAKELVAARPHVILASTTPVLAALMRETSSIPIVFVSVSNPVGAGFVPSLARPGGNVTGLANYEGKIASKWLAQLKELVPAVTRIAVLLHRETAAHKLYWDQLAAAAPSLGVVAIATPYSNVSDIESALNAIEASPSAGLLVFPYILAVANRNLIIRLADQKRLPAIYPFRVFIPNGGLMSYGIDLVDAHRRVSSYVDRILKGDAPAALPVQLQTKFTLAINLKTAKALGLSVPSTLLALADEVIE
jgi:putative ABC transport system substrate-binding protein